MFFNDIEKNEIFKNVKNDFEQNWSLEDFNIMFVLF